LKTNKHPFTLRPFVGRGRALSLTGGVGMLLVTLAASGFDPDSSLYGHSMISDAVTGSGYNRWGDKLDPLTAKIAYVPGGPREDISFSDQASSQIVLGARSMDFLPVKLEGAGINGTYLILEDFPFIAWC
jgi:hypothetical protein